MTLEQFLSVSEIRLPMREEMVKNVAKFLFSNICTNDNKYDALDYFGEMVADDCTQGYYKIQEKLDKTNDYDLCNDVFDKEIGDYYVCYDSETPVEKEIVAELRKLLKEEIRNRWLPVEARPLQQTGVSA